MKYTDDTVIVSLLRDGEIGHQPHVLDDFLSVCEESFLNISAKKTKELNIDFRHGSVATQGRVNYDQQVEVVDSLKYLCAIIENKLRFDKNCEVLCKKDQQCLFCLGKLARFQVNKSLMMFYSAFIECVISFCIICWYGNLSVKNKNSII